MNSEPLNTKCSWAGGEPDSHYDHKEDEPDQRVLLCAPMETTLNEVQRKLQEGESKPNDVVPTLLLTGVSWVNKETIEKIGIERLKQINGGGEVRQNGRQTAP